MDILSLGSHILITYCDAYILRLISRWCNFSNQIKRKWVEDENSEALERKKKKTEAERNRNWGRNRGVDWRFRDPERDTQRTSETGGQNGQASSGCSFSNFPVVPSKTSFHWPRAYNCLRGLSHQNSPQPDGRDKQRSTERSCENSYGLQ